MSISFCLFQIIFRIDLIFCFVCYTEPVSRGQHDLFEPPLKYFEQLIFGGSAI